MMIRALRETNHTEYCNTKPAKSSLGIFNAPRRSSRVKVIPIPSIVMVRPIMVKSGVTQLKALGFTSPSKHPRDTHTGNAVDTASPRNSTHSPKLLFFSFSAGKSFDETPQRVKSSTLRRCLHVSGRAKRDLREISRVEQQEMRRREGSGVRLYLRKEFAFNGVVRAREITEEAIFFSPSSAIRFSDRSNEEDEETYSRAIT